MLPSFYTKPLKFMNLNLPPEKQKWIEVRHKALTDYFNVPQSQQAEVDKVFADMAEIANRCNDQGEFETEMLTSPVSTAYNNLFTLLARHVKAAPGTGMGSTVGNIAKGTAASVAKQQIRNGIFGFLVNLLPSWITDWWIYRKHNIPVVSEIETARNIHDQFAGRASRAFKERQTHKPETP